MQFEQLFRETRSGSNDWLLFMLVLIAVSVACWAWKSRHAYRDSKAWAKKQAADICAREWKIIKGTEVFNPKGFVIEIQTLDCSRRIIVPFFLGHPDIPALKALERYDQVRFKHTEQPLPNIPDIYVCALIRLVQ